MVESRLHRLIGSVAERPDAPQSVEGLGTFVEICKKEGYGRSRVIRSPDGLNEFKRQVFDHVSPEYAISRFDQCFRLRISASGEFPTTDGRVWALHWWLFDRITISKPIEDFYPKQAITRPITAVATMKPADDAVREVTIRLFCPLTNVYVDTGDGPKPPAAGSFCL